MAIVSKEPVYRLKDERFLIALCYNSDIENFINLYFINGDRGGIKSLKVQGIECCYGGESGEDEILSVVEQRYSNIPKEGYILLTEINTFTYEWDEYILSFTIVTGEEKVIGECTIYKESSFSGAFHDYIFSINKRGKALTLETRSFNFTV